MNHKMNSQTGFTLIELIVVIVILGILAVTAAPKFMNLTSDANASVVKGLAGSVKSAYQMVYAKSRLHTSSSAVCASEDCSTATSIQGNNNTPSVDGVIVVTNKGYPASVVDTWVNGAYIPGSAYKYTIAGAVDLGIAWGDYGKLCDSSNNNPSDWIVCRADNNAGLVFIPKSAPTTAKTSTNYTSTATESDDKAATRCGVLYTAKDGDKSAPVVKVFVKGC